MNVIVITLLPEIIEAIYQGITGRAIAKGLVSIDCINPRSFTNDIHQSVDDRPYGGGPGMVMLYEPLKQAILSAKETLGQDTQVIYLSPQGQPLTQAVAQQLTLQQSKLILLCGRYEGIDQRIIDHFVDVELSIGDYVLSGGEIPALTLLDAMIRLIPGALGHDNSAKEDSFNQNGLLDHPHYTRPEQIDGYQVPKVLLSGDHKAIKSWREQQSAINTWQKRPDLVKRAILSEEQIVCLRQHKEEEQ